MLKRACRFCGTLFLFSLYFIFYFAASPPLSHPSFHRETRGRFPGPRDAEPASQPRRLHRGLPGLSRKIEKPAASPARNCPKPLIFLEVFRICCTISRLGGISLKQTKLVVIDVYTKEPQDIQQIIQSSFSAFLKKELSSLAVFRHHEI